MARQRFGSTGDYAVSLGDGNAAVLAPGVTVTAYLDPVGGAALTDLVSTDGVTPIPDGELVTDVNGAIPEFYGPDGVTAVYLDAGNGRRRTLATSLGDEVAAQGTALAAHTGSLNPHGTRLVDLTDVYKPSIDDLVAGNPFYIAHRGSGGEYPEHTAAAYEAALNAGARAVEVSVQITADGQLVCFHDTTLARMTGGTTGAIADYTYAELRNLVKVDASATLGSGWETQPIPLLRDVLDRLYGRAVIFLEAKTAGSIVPLQSLLLQRYPGCQDSVVWKQYYTNSSLPWARTNGFFIWSYMDPTTTDTQLNEAVQPDAWGVPHSMSDSRIAEVVARGLPVICWEVHRRSDVTRLSALGVTGMMCSQFSYVLRDPATPILSADRFATSIKAPGDIGLNPYDATFALKYDGDGGVRIDRTSTESVLLGSLCPTPADGYVLSFDMKFAGALPSSTLHAGIAFGKPDDSKYQFNASNASGGYHMVFRGNGDLQLYTHTAGVTSGTKIGEVLISSQPADAVPVADQWMNFTVEVTASQVILTRTDTSVPVVITANNTAYRGGYIHLSNGSINSGGFLPHWRNVSVA